jgi:hypothetical protein
VDACQHAAVLFAEADRLLGPQPSRIVSQGEVDDSATVSNFKQSAVALNPRLVTLYERVNSLRAILQNYSQKAEAPITETGGFVARCPYRFTSLLPKAMEITGLVRSLGSELLSAYERGDTEYLEDLRIAHERQLLDLGLEVRQRQWQESDWEVQALQQSMAGALTRSRYFQGLMAAGLIGEENNYVSSTHSATAAQQGAAEADAIGQVMNVIPDFFWGWAGLGPEGVAQIPCGTKFGCAFAAEGRVLGFLGELSTTDANLSLTNSGWIRRAAEWQNELNVIAIEIAQTKRNILAAERRRDGALHELNTYQQQMEHTAEVQNFIRDKFTKQELYLFLQQETATLYRQAYDLAVQTARKLQDAFCFENGVTADLLPESSWNNFREGLMVGQKLEFALSAMDRKYQDNDVREYELTKHISLRLDIPFAFLQLKTLGWCEIDLPEWMFDLDYPGQYMRRIKTVSLTLPCVVGPYVGVHCRLKLLSSSTRTDPTVSLPVAPCGRKNDSDDFITRRLEGTDAVATSSGQVDSGLFELNFRDERYLPFEYSGAISRWRIELPPENNQFDLTTLTDVVMHLNYTSREGGPQWRKIAHERAQSRLPGDGTRLFDVRHEFPDSFALLESRSKDRRDLPLHFTRNHFPFLSGRRAVTIIQMEIFIETYEAVEVGQHIDIQFINREGQQTHIECIVSTSMPQLYHGSFNANFGPITRDTASHKLGQLRVASSCDVSQFYIVCHYTAAHAR